MTTNREGIDAYVIDALVRERDELRSEVITLEWSLSEATKAAERLRAALEKAVLEKTWCCTNCLRENDDLDRCRFCGAASPDAAHRYARTLGASAGMARADRMHVPARVAQEHRIAVRDFVRSRLDQAARRVRLFFSRA